MTAMFPIPVWPQGTTQPSTPVNDSFLRTEVLQRGATSIISTPPGSPSDGTVHIVGASPTGAWSTFAQNDVVLWRSGTWYRFAPFSGWLKQVGSDVRRYDGAAWVVVSGGGGSAVPVEDEGGTVVASPTAINFVGAGVTVTNSGGVATVNIPGGGGSSALSIAELQSAWDAFWVATIGGASGNVFGMITPTFVGTPTAQVLSGSSFFNSIPWVSFDSTAASNSISSCRHTYDHVFTGFGFRFSMVFGIKTGATVASHRLFMGLRAQTSAATDVEPSTIVNGFGVGYDSGDTQFQFLHNDASGTATKVALGALFPKPTSNGTTLWRLDLWSTSSSSVNFALKDLATGDEATGSVSTNIPSGTQGMNCNSFLSAGGTSVATALCFSVQRYSRR